MNFFIYNIGLRLCKYKSCCGKWIPISSFYRHTEDDLARKQRALCPKFSFDENAHRDPKLQSPLFEGSETTILEAVTEHLYVFSVNHGMSKGAVSDVLQSHKATLPKPNQLPGSFEEAKRMIKHLLIPYQNMKCASMTVSYFETNTWIWTSAHRVVNQGG